MLYTANAAHNLLVRVLSHHALPRMKAGSHASTSPALMSGARLTETACLEAVLCAARQKTCDQCASCQQVVARMQGDFSDALEVMKHYGQERMQDGNGVTLPSQRR